MTPSGKPRWIRQRGSLGKWSTKKRNNVTPRILDCVMLALKEKRTRPQIPKLPQHPNCVARKPLRRGSQTSEALFAFSARLGKRHVNQAKIDHGCSGTSNRPSRSQGSIRDKLRTSLRKIHYICNTYVETKDRRIWQTGLKVASYSNTPQHWKHKSEPNERLYQRIAHVPAPDQFWVTDTTYIRTTKGSCISRW